MTVHDTASPPFVGRGFDQICFVVNDLAEAVDYWKRTSGVERWAIAYDLAKHQQDKEYWGEPEDFQFSCAYAFAGDTLIELARHDGGRSVYQDWLTDHGPGPHHVGFRLAGGHEYAAAERHYSEAGVVKAQAGWFKADTGGCRWSYWDTRAMLGCYTELYYLEGAALTQFDKFRRGEVDSLIPS